MRRPRIRRLLANAPLNFMAGYVFMMTIWALDEADEPGQQLGNPILPSLVIGAIGATLALVAGLLVCAAFRIVDEVPFWRARAEIYLHLRRARRYGPEA